MDEGYGHTDAPPPVYKIGRTTVNPLVLGQSARNITCYENLSCDAYSIGEVVAVLRSNGKWTIGQIKAITSEVLTVACEQKRSRVIFLPSIPSALRKIIGPYYIFEGHTPAVQQKSTIRGTPPEITIGESVFKPLVIGQQLPQEVGRLAADWDIFYPGEVVAVRREQHHGWTIGEVQSASSSAVMIIINESRQLKVPPDALEFHVRKLIGSFYMAAFACPVSPPSPEPGAPHNHPSPSSFGPSSLAPSENAPPVAHFDDVEGWPSPPQGLVPKRNDKKLGKAPQSVDQAHEAHKHQDDQENMKNLKECCDQQREREITEVFEAHSGRTPDKGQHIPKENLHAALRALKIYLSDLELEEYFLQNDSNGDGVIDLDEFRAAVLMPSPVENWAATLNLPRLLAHYLPRQEHSGQTFEPIRAVAALTEERQEEIAKSFCDELKATLKEHVARLHTALLSLAQRKDTQDVKKFDVVKMDNCGTIKDFFGGLQSRIGSSHEDFFFGMKSEHCEKQTCDLKFETPNFHIETTSRKEWGIVVDRESCPDEHKKEGRCIPNIDDLVKSEAATKSNLSRQEVIGLVLYTGPMFHVYNTILRRTPPALYERYKTAKNFFSTTIHVIVSAVLNISRNNKLPDGLRLYRGLGGTTALPDSFFRSDENGCKGFVEWGFMSTTSKKEVAIKYSGVKEDKPLPFLLSIRVSAVDRGACIRDFSQYKNEVEYLYVPCSFLQQDGPPLIEVGDNEVIKIFPVRVNTNLKSLTVQETIAQKKKMHIEAFKCLIVDVNSALDQMAGNLKAEQRLLEDSSRDEKHTVEGFCARIIEQCREKLAKHEAVPEQSYANPNVFQGLVLDMMDVKGMAVAKLEEWLDNKAGSYIRFRWNAQLRTVQRRWIAHLENAFETCPSGEKRDAAIRLCKVKKLIVGSVDEKNELGETRIMAAAAEGYAPEHLNMLVAAGADVNQARHDGVAPMWLAAQFGHCPTIQTLCVLNASIDQAANDGATPIYIAAQNGKYECIELLCKLGANVNAADNNGLTPVHQAAMNGQHKCIELLFDKKANVLSVDKNGLTAVHYAAMNGHSMCIESLHKAGAPLDFASEDHDGCTPLHAAAKNGKAECIRLLCQLDASLDLTKLDKKGNTPADLAGKGTHTACMDALQKIHQLKGVRVPSFKTSPESFVKKKLVISTGDISDIDGFFALAHYANTGADVLFIMNYPGYIGVSPAEVDENYADNNPGLGYKYSAKEVFANGKTPQSQQYDNFMQNYGNHSDNDRMKAAMTDLAYIMANSVWNEARKGGRLMFCIGGINAINPFSAQAIKNEVSIYSEVVERKPKTPQNTNEGSIYDENAEPCTVDWSAYSDIYIDFNGSMAFWNESWQNTLSSTNVVKKIQGAFIMGGVYADKPPTTMPSIPNVMNRFSCATMNQLYHPQKAGEFFAFLKQNGIEAYTITNNEIGGLATVSDSDSTVKTFEGVEGFMRENGLEGEYLKKLVNVYYNSQYQPPRKPFDFYTALALTTKMRIIGRVPSTYRRLHFSSVYGATFVSKHETWGPTIQKYAQSIDTKPSEHDDDFQKKRKENFVKELEIMKTMTTMNYLDVHNVFFQMDEWKLSIINTNQVFV